MCLITNKPEKIIADKDITVYKILTDGLKSPYMYFQYTLDKLYESDIKEDDEMTAFDHIDNAYKNIATNCYSCGFHSSFSLERLKNTGVLMDEGIFKCTVPKGSEYIKGFEDLLVSNKIIINELIFKNKNSDNE